MKCLVLSVLVLGVVFAVNCRDVPGQTEGSSKAERLVKETADTGLDVPARPQWRRTDNSQQLVETDIAAQHKERAEDHEIEIRTRNNKCKEDADCATKNGECIGKKDICSGTILSGKCGKKCECCVVDNIDMKIDTLELQMKRKIDNQTRDLDEIITNLKDDINIEMASNVNNLSSNLEQELANLANLAKNTLNDTITDMKDDIHIEMASNVNNLSGNLEQELANLANQIDTELTDMKDDLSSNLEQELANLANQMDTDLTDMKGDIEIEFQDMTKVLEDIVTNLQEYQTSIACEGRTVNIKCEAGRKINLIWGNYGRLSVEICNSNNHGYTNTDCKSSTSMKELGDRCSGKTSCNVAASNSIFGDPCHGDGKYIEMHYTCE